MNCPECGHSVGVHHTRGCYHVSNDIICDCRVPGYDIELDALKSENARLRAALGEYANIHNWYAWNGFSDYTAWDWERSDGNANGYDLAQKALQGQAE